MDDRLIQIIIDAFPQLLQAFFATTVPLTILSFILAGVISVVAAMILYANVPVLKTICRFYIWVIRGTPLLVQLYLVFFGLPSLDIYIDAFPAAVLVFGLNEGAYMAESMRAALESVPKGQLEAGYCVRLNYIQIMWHIVLPQAYRIAFPSLSNSLIALVKSNLLSKTDAARFAGVSEQEFETWLEAVKEN